MDLNLEQPRDHFFIRSVGDEGIRVVDTFYPNPLIVSPKLIEPDWPVNSFEDLSEANLQLIFDMKPDVVLIGCGRRQKFLPPATQMLFLQRQIGVEVMVTEAACYTFNILVAEGRPVVAALLPLK
jgi:uncharacterized protein